MFRGEYFLAEYMSKIGNFDFNLLHTGFQTEGYFYDPYFDDGDLIAADATNKNWVSKRVNCSTKHDTKQRYEFAFVPNNGFLCSPELLMKDCELKLSFDRANPKIALTKIHNSTAPTKIDIVDCYAITEYVSSPGIRSFFNTIENMPITYEYEEMEVLVKGLPTGTTTIQIDNIRGGNVPNYMFVGLIPSANLQGVYDKGATSFKQHNVEELNITLSGNSVSGYPIKIAHGSPVFPLHKFLDSTGRLYNVFSGKAPSYTMFQQFMWIWAHKFEAEMTSQGWIGINLKLSTEFTAQMSMVIWIISPNALTIDKYHQIERINL